ncbi:MAG TPA: LysM peptidoglycan-binding domain-containing protein, partial [Methylococcaceae bacterium]|nr:LysM peptidoglycan-binding domain-containing protein [Methylococcaceae bacterium]
PLTQPPKNHPLFVRVRSAVRNKQDLRVVVDLTTAVRPKSFSLNPSKNKSHRLVVDLFPKPSALTTLSAKKGAQPLTTTKTVKQQLREIVIAIDAGHGGEDPGARGPRGTQEKKVVFDIAKKLAALINKKSGMKAVMVRKGDYYIKLRKRMEIARAAKADLFVSIHADAFKNAKVKGASVFTVSNRGASSEAARWLADHENSADLVGGVKLADKEDMLATVLMDLSQTATKEASRNIAGKILKNFKRIGHLHKQNVQKAGFMVLKSPDIPSILVETAFISNPDEERKLRSRKHQTKMANAIYQGLVSYFEQYAPSNTYFALNVKKQHVISRGETLSGIAVHYGVTMKAIKTANALASTAIQVGQVLRIPKG